MPSNLNPRRAWVAPPAMKVAFATAVLGFACGRRGPQRSASPSGGSQTPRCGAFESDRHGVAKGALCLPARVPMLRCSQMIPVEEAVRNAVSAVPRFLGGRQPESLRIEEVVPPDSDLGEWRVTLSYLEPGVEPAEHPALKSLRVMRGPPPPERVLRVITVRADNGEARAMVLRPTG